MTKYNTPALRFDGFDGEWGDTTLEQLFEYGGSGGTPSKSRPEFYGGDIPFLGIADIRDRVITHTNKTITELGLKNSAAWKIPAGAISLAMYASVGRVGIAGMELTTSQAFYNMVFSNDATRSFVYAHLAKMELMSEWDVHISTGTQRNLNAFKVRTLPIKIPSSFEEQRAIGVLFAVLDALIEQHRAKLANLQQTKTALMQRMFPRDGADEPELRLGVFSGVWESRTLSELTAINNGLDYKHLNEGDIPVYGTGGYMLSVDRALSYKTDAIGIGRKGTIDKPYMLRAPFWTVDTLFYITAREGANLQFLLAQFQRIDWKSKNTATGVPSLTSVTIGQTSVSIPPTLEEQRAIGEVFSNLDALITAEHRYITQLTQAKTALLQRMFV
ncbi:restriction endonuclease subunit S [Corynebacterium sp. UMB4614]|uniref:restriction endonuclease subunit S n=1 Tax=Corynebacterium sp. UMB4614 TaxID=3046334 RepID=UPI00254A5675|nr:restriction endonuclease subunit S [Corynebacterium sp. UMB4614]MDK7134358.1 restriction endonuclease subunit S [Corynebacterium sp. UMB4614]